MAELPEHPNTETLSRRLLRGAWCGAYAGALAGMAIMFFFVFALTDSTTSQKYQFAALILTGLLVGFLGQRLLGSRVRPYALAGALGAILGIAIAELVIYFVIQPTAGGIGSPLFYALIFGALPGTLAGAVCCTLIAFFSVAVTDALRPWGWLISAGIIVVVALVIRLVGASQRAQDGEWYADAIFLLGFALAGWIAQNEYLRLRTPARH